MDANSRSAESSGTVLVERIVQLCWLGLPATHRNLLEEVGASQWLVTDRSLGSVVDEMLDSAGHPDLPASTRTSLQDALGAWIPGLRVVLINADHPCLTGLDTAAHEAFVAHVTWHEWGHALSLARCSFEDVSAGAELIVLAPPGVQEAIRDAGYRSREYTHEIVAETYALMMARRLQGHQDKPPWLHDKIYKLLKRATGWSD